jgi:hypothetical protein
VPPVDDIKFPADGGRPIDAKLLGTRGDGIPANAGDGGPLLGNNPVDGVAPVDATPVHGVPSDDVDAACAAEGGGPNGAGGFLRGRFLTAS